jgi:hypothetical protein
VKKVILAVAVAAVATMAVASSASAGVLWYQTQTGLLTINLPEARSSGPPAFLAPSGHYDRDGGALAEAAMSLRWLVSLYRVRARLRCGPSRSLRKES